MKDFKKLKIIVIILILIIIVISACLILLNMKNKVNNSSNEDKDGNYDESNIKPIINENVEAVKNHSKFYAVADAIQKYYDYLSLNVSNLDVNENTYEFAMAQTQGITTESGKAKALYSLLDVDYINEKGITEDNVITKSGNLTTSVQFYPLAMDYLDGTVNQRYAVLGKIRALNDKTKYKNVAFIVTVGVDTSLYMLKPLDASQYSKVQDIELEEYNNQIKRNNYNILKYTSYKDDKITQKYFDYYKEIVHYDKDEIYNLMSEEYRNKRFGSEEVFEKYINNIEQKDESITAEQYTVNNYDDYKEYVCKDQYGNLYIFKEKSPMDITIELDTYTLDNDTFNEKYNSSSTQYKVMMNIDKVRQMMNARDYRTMFNYLDETFRTTYFENDEDKFEEYMRYQFSSHYTFEFGEYSDESGVSIQEVTMKDMNENNNGDIGERFYMQLNEGTDFVMSFNVIGK